MTARRFGALPSWKYGGCCQSPRNGVVRYLPVAVLAAYVGSIPTSAGSCRNGTVLLGPLRTSVKFGDWWHDAQPASLLNRRLPRFAACRSKLPSGGFGVCRLS